MTFGSFSVWFLIILRVTDVSASIVNACSVFDEKVKRKNKSNS